ncbi:hypothetical protein KOI35_11805 [Actinoplanes bogorensis]|uniref:Immunity protein 35 domain-containing protein n=1 Tax=Paractinoplanes bogorensis TaxID=1610840 RepID=A0ABS5YL97_9ACTN|nr:hypothetical protein [Actinoplanes bogorensis]MBU2664178.1 hypothetical protein [Actinoplanes bogorensis]
MIDGYEDDPVVAGEDLLDRPGFWAAYLMGMCERDENVPDLFGVDNDDLDTAADALMDEEAWPAFRIPFGGGHTAVVVFANFSEDAGIDYFVTHADWDRRGFLATIDGHFAGPGLAWRELVHIARTPDRSSPGVHDPHARLLLLLPALGDRDTPADAVDVVARALRSAQVVPEHETERLVARLLDHPMFAAARWTMPEPHRDGDEVFGGILVCDAEHSPRRGIRLAQGITREQNDRLARALGTGPG